MINLTGGEGAHRVRFWALAAMFNFGGELPFLLAA
jgi:hypothetical protein